MSNACDHPSQLLVQRVRRLLAETRLHVEEGRSAVASSKVLLHRMEVLRSRRRRFLVG